ncbi:histidine kinase [Mucilaginibacter sp. KACC 22773]|uniref:sensor histidine kinase n=1 Tax=Mucilaginibacter sp. KACC 22773 TaxID=3025671 RepID=UPI002366657C|nr:histidine kinase [Mucilaginibacter sp. KACC 22773]WDF79321.1 histidine kinase [Mucilaginibacter sp. KACC 22773]
MSQNYKEIKLFLFMGIAVMLFLFASVLLIFIFFQRKKFQYQKNIQRLRENQQNQLIEAAVRSEEVVRHRIAEDLHDEVGAILSSSKLHFQGIKINVFDEKNNELYEKAKELLDEAIKQVRDISHNLHSGILKELGLNTAIQHFAEKVIHNSNIIQVTTALAESYTAPTTENDISIYRIFQELVNNIIKYANAKKLHISSVYENHALRLTIFHDGNGLTQKQYEELRFKKNGLGLKNIQSRIILIKGQLSFSQVAGGYCIDIYVKDNFNP